MPDMRLHPCPFCGHMPDRMTVRPATGTAPPLHGIFCPRCGVQMTDEFLDELTLRWNTRVQAPFGPHGPGDAIDLIQLRQNDPERSNSQ